VARDLLDRVVAEFPISDMMARLKAPATNPVSTNNTKQSNESNEKIYDAIKELTAKLDPQSNNDMDGSKKWVESIFDYIKGSKSKSSKKQDGSTKQQIAYMAIMAEATSKLWEASQSQNTLWVGLSHLTNKAQKDIAEAIAMSNCCGATSKTMSEVADRITPSSHKTTHKIEEALRQANKQPTAGSKDVTGTASQQTDELNLGGLVDSGKRGLAGVFASLAINKLKDGFVKITNELDINMEKMLPSFKDLNNFREGIRSIIHMQEGFSKENREIENAFFDITKATIASGVSYERYAQVYLSNLERGFDIETAQDKLATKDMGRLMKEETLMKRRVGRMKSIQTSALNTATMLNINGDALNEMFMDWHYHLGLSSVELAEMGRHMQSISRTSGVTGNQLEKAMQSSNAVIKNLERQGVASIDNIKKVTQFMTSAQKFGFENASEFMSILTDSDAYLNSDMSKFLDNVVGSIKDVDLQESVRINLRMGTILEDKTAMKGLSEGLEQYSIGVFDTFGSKITDATKMTEELQRLRSGTTEEKMRAMQIQNHFKNMGMEIGEVQKAILSTREQTMSLGDKFKEATDKLKEAEKFGTGSDKYKQALKQKQELETGMYADAFGKLTQYSKALNEVGGDFGKLDEKTKAALEESLGQVFGDTQIDGVKLIDQFQKGIPQAGQSLIKNLSERSKSVGINFEKEIVTRMKDATNGTIQDMQGFQKALATGDEVAMNALNEVMQTIGIKEKASQDPIAEIREWIREIHAVMMGDTMNISKYLPLGMHFIAYTIGGGFTMLAGVITNALSLLAGSFILNKIRGGGGGGGFFGGGGGKGNASAPESKDKTVLKDGKNRRARGRSGRGNALLTAGSAVGGYLLGSWFSKSDDDLNGSSVLDVLKQIEINTRNCCGGGVAAAGELAAAGLPAQNMPQGSYLSEKDLNNLDRMEDALVNTRLGFYLASDLAGNTSKNVLSAATNSIDEAAKIAAQGADDIAKAATGSIESVSAASAKGATTVATAATGSPVTAVANMPSGGGVASAASGATPAVPSPTSGTTSVPKTGGGFMGGLKSMMSSAGGAISGAKSRVGQLWSSGTEALSKVNASVNSGVNSVVAYGAEKTGIKATMDWLKNSVGKIVPEWLASSGSSVGNGLKGIVGKIGQYAGPVGLVIEAGLTGMDIYKAANEKGVPMEDLYKEIGSAVIKNGLGFLGGTLAAMMISAPQTLGIPSWVLAPAAFMGGDWLGGKLGEMISDYIGGAQLGKMIFNLGSTMKWWPSEGERQSTTNLSPTSPEASVSAASATTSPTELPKFQEGTRSIIKAGVAQLHQGEMIIPSKVWEKITAMGSGVFGAGTDVKSTFGKTFNGIKSALNPISFIDKMTGGKLGQMMNLKLQTGTTSEKDDIQSLIVSLKELIEVIKSKKCCEVGMSAEGAFEGDQASEAMTSELNRSMKMQTLKAEDKQTSVKDILKNIMSGEGLSRLLESAFTSNTDRIKETFASVANFGLFDKEKTSEAHDQYSESYKKSLIENSRMSFEKDQSKVSLMEMLSKSFEKLKSVSKSVLSPVSLGLFDAQNAKEAQDLKSLAEIKSINEFAKTAIVDKLKTNPVNALGVSMGLFDPDKASEANDDYVQQNSIFKMLGMNQGELNNIIKSSIITKQDSEKREKNIIAEVSRALNYDSSASDAANKTLVSTNSIDYSDDMKGEVGSLGLSRVAAESSVAQAKYGDSANGTTSVLPSMDTIADYLVVEQARKLDQMILVMEQIRDRLSVGGIVGSEIIRANTDMLSPPTRPGIKNIAKDLNRGTWDLTFSDSSPGSITTDGRGGN
jgi:molybdopterin converting factor small subunit